eukprot:2068961-Prymnesium_polylepis.1
MRCRLVVDANIWEPRDDRIRAVTDAIDVVHCIGSLRAFRAGRDLCRIKSSLLGAGCGNVHTAASVLRLQTVGEGDQAGLIFQVAGSRLERARVLDRTGLKAIDQTVLAIAGAECAAVKFWRAVALGHRPPTKICDGVEGNAVRSRFAERGVQQSRECTAFWSPRRTKPIQTDALGTRSSGRGNE